MKSLFGAAGLLFLGLKTAENIRTKYQERQAHAKLGSMNTNHREIASSLAHPEG